MSFLIETVVFDIDDTIYDQQAPFKKSLTKFFPYVSKRDYYPIYLRFRHHSDTTFNKVVKNQWSLEYMRFFRINQSLLDLGYGAIDENLAAAFQSDYEIALTQIEIHQEVKKSLDFLQEQAVPMAIITNGPTLHQHKKISQLGLKNWIDEKKVIVSEESGYEKPEAEIFHLGQERFQVKPETCLYVGDNYINDVAGANSAGWRSLWFNHRQRQTPQAENISDIEITSFTKLLPAFKKIFQ